MEEHFIDGNNPKLKIEKSDILLDDVFDAKDVDSSKRVETSPPIKRGRGRPRKTVINKVEEKKRIKPMHWDAKSLGEHIQEVLEVKRGRGRPKGSKNKNTRG